VGPDGGLETLLSPEYPEGDRGLTTGQINNRDLQLIREYLAEKRATAGISITRCNKITCTLISWRRFIPPFQDLTIGSVYFGIESLPSNHSIRGRPFKQNTIADHVVILKGFLSWIIESEYLDLPEKKIRRIKSPPRDTMTKREADLLAVIQHHQWPEFTVPMLQKASGLTSGNIHKCIHGHVTHGKVYSGLLEKCPAISYCDRTVVTDDEACGVSMRRRTNAYTFDREIFASWCAGGAVWFDNDGDDTSKTSKNPDDFHRDASNVEVFGNELNEPDSENTPNNNSTLLCTHDHFNKSPETQQPKEGGACASACHCDPGIVEVLSPDPSYPPAIKETVPESGPFSLQQSTSTPEIPGSVTKSSGVRPKINARDYKPLDIPEKTPCYVCGGAWSLYVEKLTEERRGREDKTARRICKTCYQGAKKRAQRHATILPGTLDVTRMERLKATVGRCTICELDKAAYIDRGTDTKLCEYCYQRAVQAQAHGEVSG